MNVLEKILEKIERTKKSIIDMSDKEPELVDAEDWFYEGIDQGKLIAYKVAKEIIHSHMDEFPKCSDCSRRKWYQKGYEDEKNNDGWISVDEKLPEVQEGLEDMYCPEFNVTIKGAERATTLKYSWDGTWFDDYGTVYNVIAWQPLPERYKGGDDRA